MAEADLDKLKQAIRDRMLRLESHELEVAQAHYRQHLKDSLLDDREAHDNSDIAEAREAADLAAAFDHPVQAHHAKVDVLENLDFSVTDTVRPGAVVEIGDRRFVVAVATDRFEVDGVAYMGISQQSPIYLAMDGLAAGDGFEFNGRQMTVGTVF